MSGLIRHTRIAFGLIVLLAISGAAHARTIEVQSGDEMGLINAIDELNFSTDFSNSIKIIDTGEDFVFEQPFGDTDSALPEINMEISILAEGESKITFRPALGQSGQFRLFHVGSGGKLSLNRVVIRDFGVMDGDGGAILVDGQSASLFAFDSRFINNRAGGAGGAISIIESQVLEVNSSEFFRNDAEGVGGAIDLGGMFERFDRVIVAHNTFSDNTADIFGCDVNVSLMDLGDSPFPLALAHNVFGGESCSNVRIENPSGRMTLRGNTFGGNGEAIDSTAAAELFSNIFDIDPPGGNNKGFSNQGKATCNDFGSQAFESLGFNINRDDACDLDHPTDLPETDPMTLPAGQDGIIALAPGSPAIDSGADTLVEVGDNRPTAPCGYRDARGLGRPQDANGDGVFECDRGAYEVQGGPDIGAPASGAYFDVNRNGEGVFLEILPDGRAVIGFFTHNTGGTGAAWFVGVGRVIGNSVVFDELLAVTGGAFGPAFDPNEIVRTEVGGLSLVFPDCGVTTRSGRMTFEARPDSELEDLLNQLDRLSFVVPCNGSPAATSGRSGEFFDPARDGEGIFVQWLPDGRFLLIWYTFDPDGNPLWIISGDATFNGNTVTFELLYPVGFTRFGQQFDPSEVTLEPWGTGSLQYLPGCDRVVFGFDSTANGFGSGDYDYVRLTSLAGTSCDL